MNTNASNTEKIYRLNTERDLYFVIANGVQKPVARAEALTALKHVGVMNTVGSWVTFTAVAR